jgi:hypothetical protein
MVLPKPLKRAEPREGIRVLLPAHLEEFLAVQALCGLGTIVDLDHNLVAAGGAALLWQPASFRIRMCA